MKRNVVVDREMVHDVADVAGAMYAFAINALQHSTEISRMQV